MEKTLSEISTSNIIRECDTSKFPWDGNELVRNAYCANNYKIVYTKSSTKRGVVFFTSNGLYYPNNENAFKKFLRRDKYEWSILSKQKCVYRYFEKIIFVRDVYKQWYVKGISNDISDIDKLYLFLKKELHGYEITTCGSSSGGYMAALLGSMLGAERIFDNCGQFDLNLLDERNPYIMAYKNDHEKNKYYCLKEWIKDSIDNIYYFYPASSENDIKQRECIKNLNVKSIAVEGNVHGKTINSICFPFLVTLSKDELDSIFFKCKDRVITKDELFYSIVPAKQRLEYRLFNIFKRT